MYPQEPTTKDVYPALHHFAFCRHAQCKLVNLLTNYLVLKQKKVCNRYFLDDMKIPFKKSSLKEPLAGSFSSSQWY